MHIAFFVDRFPDLSTTFIHNQVIGLLERGHDVVIYAQGPGRYDASHSDVEEWGLEGRTLYLGQSRASATCHIRVLGALLARPSASTRLLGASLGLSPRIAGSTLLISAALGIGRPPRFDAIHCHFGPNGNLAVLLRELGLLTGPILTTFHGYDMRLGEPSGGQCYAPLSRHGDRFLCISLHTKRRLLDWGFSADRTLIHRVGVDTNYYRFQEPPARHQGAVRVLMIGNLVTVKGHEYALRAVSEIRRMAPSLGLQLRLVGEGPEREHLESLRNELSLHDTVDIVGPLGRDSIRSELQAADLFLLPSLAEMTPVVLMEAQSVGLPVIATRVGAVDEVVREGASALLVPPGDPNALARAIVDLAREPGRWPAMAQTGRHHVEEFFDIHSLVSELEEIYHSLG